LKFGGDFLDNGFWLWQSKLEVLVDLGFEPMLGLFMVPVFVDVLELFLPAVVELSVGQKS